MYLSKPCHGKMTFPNLTFVWLYPHRPKNSAYFRCTCSVDRHVNYTWSPCRKLMITWLAIYIRIKESFFEDYEMIILVRPWSNPTKPEGLIDRFEMLMKCIVRKYSIKLWTPLDTWRYLTSIYFGFLIHSKVYLVRVHICIFMAAVESLSCNWSLAFAAK